jgi:hypothetical protein
MKKYEKLELQVKEIQKEIERLKEEEKQNTLPKDFDRNVAIEFLNTKIAARTVYLLEAFYWDSTPQGGQYWADIAYEISRDSNYKVPEEAIALIQNWVILSYQQEKG